MANHGLHIRIIIRIFMKKDIHPQYYPSAKIICACGNSFTVGSTEPEIRVEICSVCHPFYTGKQKLVDTARRVEKFEERMAKRAKVASTRKGRKVKRAALKKKKAKDVEVVKKESVETKKTKELKNQRTKEQKDKK